MLPVLRAWKVAKTTERYKTHYMLLIPGSTCMKQKKMLESGTLHRRSTRKINIQAQLTIKNALDVFLELEQNWFTLELILLQF